VHLILVIDNLLSVTDIKGCKLNEYLPGYLCGTVQ